MLASRAAAAATFVRVVRFIGLRAPLVVAGLALLDLIESSRAEPSRVAPNGLDEGRCLRVAQI